MEKVCAVFIVCLVAVESAGHNQKRVTDYIKSEGYPFEQHYARTRSGYILGLHRIPFGRYETDVTKNRNEKPVVLLQHGFAGSSDSWVLLGAGKALGFILADVGYDVWMANSRGNKYSLNHTKYNTSSFFGRKRFFDYSVHEKGAEDLPTTIKYILQETKQKNLNLVTHSEGALIYYIMGATNNKLLKQVNVVFHFAPMVYLNRYRSVLFTMSALLDRLYLLHLSYGPLANLMDLLFDVMELLSNFFFTRRFSVLPFQAFFGTGKGQMTSGMIERVYDYFPHHVPSKEFEHLIQITNSRKLRRFSHGIFNLMRLRLFAKRYNIRRNRVPAHIFYGTKDLVVDPRSINETLYNALDHKPTLYLSNKFGHYDYVYGEDAFADVYTKTLELLRTYQRNV